MESYPVSEQLDSLYNEMQTVREFYAFLSNEGYFICKDVEYDDEENGFVPINQGMTDLFYKMHGISSVELEIERRHMLEAARKGG